ncbi:site-specific integrase [Aeoliella mucimassa]|uniref:Phage integrase family protein n=1 Tax=Aeoliella mucimassa TaxID=2527972 RepID=A0A518AMH2_9BACT|nr:hypothetical protein [Aeoliella mucimassa]QDU55913.1 hypothetical protein Pan181_21150 [Aeoliella mucimassa]
MILLGINCGFGNDDCASLPIEALDLGDGWHNYWRPKTQIQRRCPLWPETVAALQRVIGDRDLGPVFVTKYGNAWIGKGRANPIAYEFRKLTRAIDIYRKEITTFYSLRRTFETVSGAAPVNQSVVDAIMGHTPAATNMAAIYRQRVFDRSLKTCSNYVRQWYRGKIKID